MNRRRSNTNGGGSALNSQHASQAILSAALQQHFMRDLKMPVFSSHSNLLSSSSNPIRRAGGLVSQQQQQQQQQQHSSSQVPRSRHSYTEQKGSPVARGSESFNLSRHNSLSHVNVPQPTRSESHASSDLTLAQRLGLAPKPLPKLTPNQWAQVHKTSQSRMHSNLPCPICQDDFRTEPQVLLSCSHVFHQVCLKSFERFSGKSCCPICRHEHYETQLIDDGVQVYRQRCATQIQSLFRGYKVRQKLWHLLPLTKQRLEKRKTFCIRKLSRAANRIVDFIQADSDVLDALLAECDQSLALSRSALHEADTRFASVSEEQWQQVKHIAQERNVPDCPICMVAFQRHPEKAQVLLTCTHVFHQSCLQSFEQFATTSKGNTGCPLCRAPYQRKVINLCTD